MLPLESPRTLTKSKLTALPLAKTLSLSRTKSRALLRVRCACASQLELKLTFELRRSDKDKMAAIPPTFALPGLIAQVLEEVSVSSLNSTALILVSDDPAF